MGHDLIDVRSSSEKITERIYWSLIPALTFVGLCSALFSGRIWWPAVSTNGEWLFVILANLSFGLALGAVLWFYRLIHTWMRLGILVGITLLAHLLKLYSEAHVPMQWREWMDIPRVGSVKPEVAAKSFGVALILFVVLPLLTTRRAKIGLAIVIAFVCATLEAATVTLVDGTQRGAWISFLTGDELGILWQPCLAFFLAVALVLYGLTTPLAVRTQKKPQSPFMIRFAAFGIVLTYWAITATWAHSFSIHEGRRIRELQAHLKAEIAKSLAEAPSFENLPTPAPEQPEEVPLLQEINGWELYYSGSQIYPAERNGGDTIARAPARRRYYGSYATRGDNRAVEVSITEYPNAEWAKYSVRNTPMTHVFIEHPDWVKQLVKFGNNVFQEGPYVFWASDRRLIFLDCQGVLPDVIDEFLKAYLAKYPSSL